MPKGYSNSRKIPSMLLSDSPQISNKKGTLSVSIAQYAVSFYLLSSIIYRVLRWSAYRTFHVY